MPRPLPCIMDAPDMLPGERLVPIPLTRDGRTVRAWLSVVPCTAYAALSFRSHAWLHPSEAATWQTMGSERRRVGYLLGRYAAKRAAGRYLGTEALEEVEVANGVFQQPILRFPAWDIPQVTLCHTEHLALAVAHQPDHILGIDAEPLDPTRAHVLRPILSDAERARLGALGFSGEDGLLLLWTAKEALSKALRCGLTAPLGVLETDSMAWTGTGDLRCTFSSFPQYQGRCALARGHGVALVLPKETQVSVSIRSLVDGTGS